MGRTTWPCPNCGQQQSATHENGEAQESRLCAACAEKFQTERDGVLASAASKKEKEASLTTLARSYGAKEEDAQRFAKLCLAQS